MSEEYDLDSGPDPASRAASEPEAVDPSEPVYAVGVGPGNIEFLTPRGRRAMAEADVVVGFESVVDFIGDVTDADLLTCGYKDELETLEAFGERVANGARGTAVLMGDPNHSGYQFLGKVEEAVDRPVRVIPGISSIQVAASRARTPLEESAFVTLHKSGDIDTDLESIREAVGDRHVLVLPRPFDWMPGDIAQKLLDDGADPGLESLVLEHLTHENESVTQTTLGELAKHAGGNTEADSPFSDISILAIRNQS